MNLLAIIGSQRKNKTTDILVGKTIEGVLEKSPNTIIKKIYLSDNEINYCKDCLSCWQSNTEKSVADCVIRDDMEKIKQDIIKSDLLIMGSPIHMGYASALMMTFLERICWTFAKPAKNYILVKDCPAPRSDKRRKAVIIAVSGIIPPRYKQLCNWATPQIKGVIKDSLNAKTVATLYAGNVWHKGVEYYYNKALKLGHKLVRVKL